MSNRVIVMVSDLDDPKHGEIDVLESATKAARMVETLLEAGFGQDRIRVFSGDEMEMRVAHRPVVALMSDDSSADDPSSGTEGAGEKTEKEPQLARSSSRAAAEAQGEVAATPFVQDGVRFSSMFRPA